MQDTVNNIQLELHVPDFDAVEEFYAKLGFKIVWKRQKHDSGDYMVMQRAGTIINFWPGNDHVWQQSYFKNFPKDTKRGYGVEIVYSATDIQNYYEEVKLFANIVEPLVKRPWGRWDFRFEDPFGYYFRVTEPHDITDPKKAVDG